MPLFEYSCRACGKQFTFLSGVVADNAAPQCPRCHSLELTKLMSSFRRGRSDDARMENLAARMENSDLDDSSTLARLAHEAGREMSAESGRDLGGSVEALLEAHHNDSEIDDENASFDESTLRGNRFGARSKSGDDGKIY